MSILWENKKKYEDSFIIAYRFEKIKKYLIKLFNFTLFAV